MIVLKEDNPSAIIEKQQVFETKNKIAYAYIQRKCPGGITSIIFAFSNKTTVFDMEFGVQDSCVDKYIKEIQAVANSFQFDK